MSLRLLLYSVTYPGEAGGVQAVFTRLGDRLRTHGHTVVRAWGAPNPAAADTMLSLPRLTTCCGIPTLFSAMRASRALLRLAQHLAECRPQVVNVHFVTCQSLYFFLLKPIFRYKVVLSVHGSDVLLPDGRDRSLLARVLPLADAITTVSRLAATRVRAYAGVDPARVSVISNGVDYDFWSAPAFDPCVEHRPPTILTVGRLHPVKGHDVLLRAFVEVRRRVPGARLLIVGDGPCRTALEDLARELGVWDAVEFAGELGPEGVRARMADARVFVLPSRSEGLPLALLEAMAAGLPSVATSVGGVPEVLLPGTGVMAPPEEPPGLADAVADLLLDDAVAPEMSRSARARASCFSASAADFAYEQVFLDLLDPKTRGDQKKPRPRPLSLSPPGHAGALAWRASNGKRAANWKVSSPAVRSAVRKIANPVRDPRGARATKAPAVSVLMPVYNTEAYLAQALESVLGQTFADFEFIVLDDGSTDRSVRIIQSYAERDHRIRFYPLEHRGYVSLLRRGLNHCRGEFVARMDSDDISDLTRFQKQITYLREHSECVAVGSRVVLIDPHGLPFEKPEHKTSHAEIEAELFAGVGWALVHPTVMMRREPLVRVGGYRQDLMISEDLDLFLRLAEVGRLANLPEVLLQYRQHLKSVNYTKYDQQRAVKRLVVGDAYRRRGWPMPQNWSFRERKMLPHPEQYRRWGWAALGSGKVEVARKHAVCAMRQAPLETESWRLMACVIRGR